MIKLNDGTVAIDNINYILYTNSGGYLYTKDLCKYCLTKEELNELKKKLHSKN